MLKARYFISGKQRSRKNVELKDITFSQNDFEIGIYHYTILAFLFFTGVFGIFLNRTNLIIILMYLELILLSVSINFISFSVFLGDITGQIFSLFILTVAAGEAAIGLAILVCLFEIPAISMLMKLIKWGLMELFLMVFLPLIGSIITGFWENNWIKT